MTGKRKPMTNENVITAARNSLALEVQARISDPTQEGLNAVFDQMTQYMPVRNALEPALVSQIGMQTVDSVAWRSPFGRVKKDPMYYGTTDEEIYVNFAKSQHFSPSNDWQDAFKTYQGYIMAMFHTINFSEQYPFTISWDNMRMAFQSKYGIRDIIRAKVESAISGYNWDEYNATVGLIGTGYDKQILPAVTVSAPTDQTTANNLLAAVKAKVGEFAFPLPQNNIAGSTASSQPTQLLWITTPQTDSALSVYSQAYAFQNDKIAIPVDTVIVDGFTNDAIVGVLCDVRFFRIREQFKRFTHQEVANTLNWNHFYTVVEQISASPFYPICVFTTDTVAAETAVTASAQTYTAGEEVKIVASLTGGTGTYHIGLIDYSIKSGAVDGTYIVPGTNILHVAEGQTGTVVVTATSRNNPTVTADINFTAGE